jgi:8-oxo-dGTP diphosphatase
MKTITATLCYLRSEGRTLMMHRNKKPGDVHKGKWNGLGGKLDSGESPEECVIREMREESGLTIAAPRLRGILTFPAFKPGEDWLVFVYTASRYSGVLETCAEGDLEWVTAERLAALPLWEGDRIFLPWLEQERFFSGKFNYVDGRLQSHAVSFHP